MQKERNTVHVHGTWEDKTIADMRIGDVIDASSYLSSGLSSGVGPCVASYNGEDDGWLNIVSLEDPSMNWMWTYVDRDRIGHIKCRILRKGGHVVIGT